MELGSKIFELRKKARLSQEQLAEKLNVTRQTISNWELGQTIPDIMQAKEIAKIFNISLDELVDNDIQNILVEKISNTERLAGIIIKILKAIGISIITIVIIAVICALIFVINKVIDSNTHESKTTITYSADSEYVKGETVVDLLKCTLEGKTYFYRFEYYIADCKLRSTGWTGHNGSLDFENNEFRILDFPEIEEEINKAQNYVKSSQYYDARELIQFIEDYYRKKGGTYEIKRYTYETTGNKITYTNKND